MNKKTLSRINHIDQQFKELRSNIEIGIKEELQRLVLARDTNIIVLTSSSPVDDNCNVTEIDVATNMVTIEDERTGESFSEQYIYELNISQLYDLYIQLTEEA